jgi:hypothetical protein
MPFRPNTYQSDQAIGQGINNLAAAFFGDPNEEAQYEHTISRARQVQDQVQRDRENRLRTQSAADLFQQGDIKGAMASLVSTGEAAYLPSLGDASLAFVANTPGSSDDEVRRALIGSGTNPSENFAASSGRADDISARDAAEAMAQAMAVQNSKNQGKGADGSDWLEATRRQKIQDELQTELINQLVDMGLPSSKDGVRTDLLPPGLMSEVLNEAWTGFSADMQPGRQPAPVGTYVNQALKRRVGNMNYTEDNHWLPGAGEEELTIGQPSTAADVLGAPGAPPAAATPAQPAAKGPPIGTRMDGHTFQGGDPNDPKNWIRDA